MSNQEIDIVVQTFNNLAFTKKFVNSLFANTTHPFRLIINDNVSTDGTVEYLKSLEKKKSNIKVLYHAIPDSGTSEGYNNAFKESTSDLTVMCGNDMIFFKNDWLDKLEECIEKDKNIAIVGCKLLYPNGLIQHAGTYLTAPFLQRQWQIPSVWEHIGRFQPSIKYSKRREMGGVTASCILFRRKIFGLFDQGYRIGTYDDIDKCVDVKQRGFKIWYAGDVNVYHFEAATLRNLPPPIFQDAMISNYKRFILKNGDWLLKDYIRDPKMYQPVEDSELP
jgi:GT2 family glycosyltransferase